MQNQKFLVIGLGRFGSSLALTLRELGCYVKGVDESKDLIDEYNMRLSEVIGGDTTDEQFLRTLHVADFDVIVLAIGTNVQASLMTAVLLRDLNAKKIVAKALTSTHGLLLEKIGVDRIIYPEREAGQRLASQLVSPNLLEQIELSDVYGVAEIMVPKSLDSIPISRVNPGGKYNINIVAVNRFQDKEELIIAPKADVALRFRDRIVVIGKSDDLKSFEKQVIERD